MGDKITLPTYSLFIKPQDLRQLRSDIWSNEHIPAKLKVGHSTYHIEIAYRGALTRDLPKKSFHINFVKPGTFQGGREIHLNAEYLDPSLIRNKLSLDFFKSLGVLSPEAKYVLLSLNGTVLGIYLQLESVDDLFLKKRGLPQGPIIYAHNDDANFSFLDPDTEEIKESLFDGYKLKCGQEADEDRLCEMIYKINTLSRSDFSQEIRRYMDIENYLRWLAGVVCTQNYDGFIQNYALYANPTTNLYEMIPWDYDGTWGRDCHGQMMEPDYFPIQGANTLTARLLDIEEFRHRYRNLLEEILATLFTPEFLEPQITANYQLLRPHIRQDPHKRKAVAKFEAEPSFILDFISKRNSYLKNQLATLL